jgi:hypothetical protein
MLKIKKIHRDGRGLSSCLTFFEIHRRGFGSPPTAAYVFLDKGNACQLCRTRSRRSDAEDVAYLLQKVGPGSEDEELTSASPAGTENHV